MQLVRNSSVRLWESVGGTSGCMDNSVSPRVLSRQRWRVRGGDSWSKVRSLLLLLFLSLLSLRVRAQKFESHVHEEGDLLSEELGGEGRRPPACSVEQLLPSLDADLSKGWSESKFIDTSSYDCRCPMLKASYFCPHQQVTGYPMWESTAVTDGLCEPVDRETLAREPLPPNSTVLFYGNSHVRQMVEGIMCKFASAVARRFVTLTHPLTGAKADVTVGRNFQCRACYSSKAMQPVLEEYDCIGKSTVIHACSCDDNIGKFEFANGAFIHYYFAHKQEAKAVEAALEAHGTNYDDYDAVFANGGNEPVMETALMLDSAAEFLKNGIPFFWQSAYDGRGDIRDMKRTTRKAFEETGAYFIPISGMTEGLTEYTKGVVENELNPHFCMPGPPDEIGVLLLQLVWAHWDGVRG